MKPTEILDALIHLEREICDIAEKMAPLRARLEVLTFMRSDVRALLNNGAPWEKIQERLSDFDAGIVPDPIEEIGPAKPDDAPYGRRADGTPKARPGRKVKEAPSREEVERAGKIVPIDSAGASVDVSDLAKAPVDEAKNAADLRVLKDVLTAWGPCPPSVLLHRSGLDADTIGAHVRAAAVIESYDGEYALEGGKLMPSIMIRLISQRPATARIDPAS